jgi:hypothetical protein
MRSRARVHVAQLGEVKRTGRARAVAILAVPVLSLVLPALAFAVASAGGHGQLTRISAATSRFLLYYSGVFALIALTAAVAAGLLATDRTVMSPERRILAQAVHRAASLIGISALGNHIMLEILAHRAGIIDGFVPFLAARKTFYMGLGTLASDLFIVIIVTGLLRRRFTSRRLLWRALHATAYAAWPMAILHSLLAGRTAKPYVDWSYGGCVAAVGLALVLRYVLIARGRNAAQGLPASAPRPASGGMAGGMPGMPPGRTPGMPPGSVPGQLGGRRRAALPAGSELAPLPEPGPAVDLLARRWQAGPRYAGPDYTGPGYAGPDYAGPDYGGQDYAGPDYEGR